MQPFQKAARTLLASPVVFGLLFAGAAFTGAPADAAIVPTAIGGFPKPNTNVACGERFTWDMTAGVAEAGADRCDHWLLSPSSPAGGVPGTPALGVGQKDLQLRFQHQAAPHGGEANPNPAAPVTLYGGRYAAGIQRSGGLVITHDGHHNVYIWSASVPAGGPPATIDTLARHIDKRFVPKWSYDPAELGGPAFINTVQASYPTDPNRPARDVPDFKVNGKRGGPLPNGASGERPTDYHIRVTLGDPYFSDMTLAYVIGEPGAFEMGELDLMNTAFRDGAEYLVPMIFDIAETENLFIAVDLTQWLSFPTEFSEGEIFEFTDGLNADLAGFMVATSPFSFDPSTGFVSSDPWTGTGIVYGTVDGGNVPEPATFTLLGLGALAVGVARRRSQASGGRGKLA